MKKDEEYSIIESFEEEQYPLRKGQFSRECSTFAESAQLMLESSRLLEGHFVDDDGGQSELLMLVARMFDDFEASKLLLLYGLPEQVPALLRDAIECMLLVRLFVKDRNAAKKWVVKLAQYSATDVNRRLRDLKTEAQEFVLYGTLSHTAHANLLGQLTHVHEQEVGQSGVHRTFHFGGITGGAADESTRTYFCLMFFLMMIALAGPLSRIRSAAKDGLDEWRVRVARNAAAVEQLMTEVAKKLEGRPVKNELQALVAKRLRVNELEREGRG